MREIETGVKKYWEHQQIDGLRHALGIFQETAGLATEGAAAYDETIWDANVEVKGKATTLDELFSKLQELVAERYEN
mgnify:FL=1